MDTQQLKTTGIPCPFTYAKGNRCCGTIYRARAYGPSWGSHYVSREDARKYRLWCSEKDDHAGAVETTESKMRMEFYPDDLPADVIDRLWSDDLLS